MLAKGATVLGRIFGVVMAMAVLLELVMLPAPGSYFTKKTTLSAHQSDSTSTELAAARKELQEFREAAVLATDARGWFRASVAGQVEGDRALKVVTPSDLYLALRPCLMSSEQERNRAPGFWEKCKAANGHPPIRIVIAPGK